MKKVMTTQETTKENKTYVRPTMEIYPMYVECQIPIGTSGSLSPENPDEATPPNYDDN